MILSDNAQGDVGLGEVPAHGKPSLQMGLCFPCSGQRCVSIASYSSKAESADGVPLDHAQVDLVPKQVTDVVDAVQDHRWPLEAQTPCNDIHILWEAHWAQHLRAEHAAVADLNPFLELLRVAAAARG